MRITFKPKDFETLRNFQKKMEAVFGVNCYVDASSVNIPITFCDELKGMIRPLPQVLQYDFQVRFVKCSKCDFEKPMVATETTTFICDGCVAKQQRQLAKQEEANA